MKDTSYINIQGWMINKLKLKGNDLFIYAIIFGFSQDNESKFEGSLKYLCESTNSTKPTVINTLKKLVDDGLLLKFSETKNNITFNQYQVNFELLEIITGSKESCQGLSNNFTGGGKEFLPKGSKETLPNNTISNNLNDKQKEKEAKRLNFTDEDFIQCFIEEGVERQKIEDWIRIRKLKKGVNSLSSFELLVNECNKHKIKVSDAVDICISRNWVSFKYSWVKDDIKKEDAEESKVLKM
jgi:hypothetical protein